MKIKKKGCNSCFLIICILLVGIAISSVKGGFLTLRNPIDEETTKVEQEEETTKKENEGKIFISEALRILTQAFDKDPFLFHKEEILTELATTYAKVGQHEIALKIAESIN